MLQQGVVFLTPKLVLSAPPQDFVSETLITGLDQPTAIEFLTDGRMLILERDGTIHIVQPGASTLDPIPFMQLTNINIDQGERGLTGIDLDPNFATNGFFYIFYTSNSPLRDTVSRFTAVGNSASLASEQIIWQAPQDADLWHHGGSVIVGPDGLLYISTGDGFNTANTSQSLTSYQGKLLRANTDGSVPSNNPFNDGAGSNYDYIWARGLRNPFRITLDAPSGKIYIGDVGGNDTGTSIEEINVAIEGANYGWPICEGSCGTAGMTSPLFSYPHAGEDASITGGFVYRGGNFPVQYQGDYFYGDYVRNFVRGLDLDPTTGALNGTFNFEPTNGGTNGPYGEIVDFEQGPDGALYYVDIGISWEGQSNPGTVRRIKYTAANQPPVITTASATPTSGPVAPMLADFSAIATDPESQNISYSWNFGDGSPVSTLQNPSHEYQQKGEYIARLTVSDGVNQTLSNPIVITVGTRPVIDLISVTTPSDQPGGLITFRAGENANFSASASDADGVLGETNYSWDVHLIHLSHTHPEAGTISGSSGLFGVPSSGHEINSEIQFQFVLTVTDSDGLKTTNAVNIIPETVNLSFDTIPTGLTLNIDGFAKVAPTVLNTVVNFQHNIEAPTTQGGYSFVSWSDSGAAAHMITAPATAQSYIASYELVSTPTPTPTPPPTGLLAGYTFNEGSGATANDVSGNNRNLALAGSPTWNTTGKYGGGLNFDGTNDRGSVASFPLPSQFTYMAWVNNPSDQDWETVVTVNFDRDWVLRLGTQVFSNGSADVSLDTSVPTGSWQHIAIVYNGSQMQAYLNGQPVGTPRSMSLGSVTNTLQVGAWINNGSNFDFFSGTMDEVRIYNRVLSEIEVQTAMNTPLSGSPTPTPSPSPTPTPTPTPTPSPTPTPTPGGTLDYLSVTTNGTIGGVSVADEDIVSLNTTTSGYQMYFDGSDVGLSATDLDAMAILPDNSLLLSTNSNVTLTGAGSVTSQDIVRFVPTSTGDTTAGTFEMYFDGSDVGLTQNAENIDAISVLPDGRVLVSTTGNVSVTGVSGVDEDILVFVPTSLGGTTSGTWAMYFDGSDVGLSGSDSEDVNALFVNSAGRLLLSTLGNFTVTGVSGTGQDVFEFIPTTLGSTTTGTYSSTLVLDGSTFGLGTFIVDGFVIQ